MNKHLYRIIFNERRGQMMVVAENADSPGKAAGGDGAAAGPFDAGPGGVLTAVLRPICAAIMMALGLSFTVAAPAFAQVKADPNAAGNQRATVLTTANGTVLVNIQTPSAGGVSRNTYSQFDVTSAGVVLNNSRTDTQTQIGGWVQGNQWLQGGPARIILNEVNSANPSQLRGYLEVAGQRAEVIIANAAGVQIDGGGFINASRVTITTGQAQMSNGNLTGFLVQGGTVSVNGQGLDASQTDYTTILTRAMQLNAGIWAKDLRVVTGANQVAVAGADGQPGAVAPVAATGSESKVALDVSHLGGMYAGKITLIGTEAGFGVRNAGSISASAGPLVIDANGWISNSGSLYSAADTNVTSKGDISGAGLIAAQNDTKVQAQSIDAATGSAFVAGMNADGTLRSTGTLTLSASGALAVHGTAAAAGSATVNASTLDVSGARVFADQVALKASAGSLDASRASISADGKLGLDATDTVRTDGAQVSAKNLALNTVHLSNVGGRIAQSGSGDLTLALPGTLDNTGGQIASNSDNLSLRANTLRNESGSIEHAGSGALAIKATTFSGQQGQVRANGSLSIDATSVDHRAASIIAQNVTIASGSLDNRAGSIESKSGATIGTGALNNAGGSIIGASALTVDAANVDNSAGTLLSTGGNAALRAADINNKAGSIYAAGNLDLHAANLGNTGAIAARGNTSIDATTVDSGAGSLLGAGIRADGTMAQAGDLRVSTSGSLSAHGQNLAAGSTNLDGSSVDVSGSQTGGAQVALRAAGGNVTTNAATVSTAGTLTATASGALVNEHGTLSGGQLAIAASSIDNAHGALIQTGTGDTALHLTGALDNTGGAISVNSATLRVAAATVVNAGGRIEHAGTGTLAIKTGEFNDAGGTILSNGSLLVDAAAMDHSGATTSAGAVDLNASSLNNRGGHLLQSGAGAVRVNVAGQLDNTTGEIVSAHALNVSALAIDNTHGLLQAGDGALALNTSTLLNTQGTLSTGASLAISTSGDLHNDGVLYAARNQSLAVAGTFDNTGSIAAQGDVTITAGTVQSSAGSLLGAGVRADGSMAATGNLNVTATGDLHANGTNLAAGDARLQGATVDVSGSQTGAANIGLTATNGKVGTANAVIGTQGTLSVSAAALDNRAGVLNAGQLNIGTGSIDNTHGTIIQSGSGNTTVALTGALDNTSGRVAVNSANLTVKAGSVTNTDGRIEHAGSGALAIDTASLSGQRGQIIGNGDLVIAAGSIDHRDALTVANKIVIGADSLDNRNGQLSQLGLGASTIAATQLDNRSGTIESNGGSTVAGATIDNRGGRIAAAGETVVAGSTSIDNSAGVLEAGSHLQLSGGAVNNAAGSIQAYAGNATLNVTDLTNTGGSIYAGGNLDAHAANVVTTGVIAAHGDATIHAATVDASATSVLAAGINADGSYAHAGNLSVTSGQTLAAHGQNLAAGSVTLNGASVNLDGGLTSGAQVNLAGDSVSTRGATVSTAGTLAIDASTGLSNDGGTLSAGQLAVHVAALSNNAGTITQTGSGDTTISMGGTLDNTAGRIAVNGANLTLGAGTLHNADGVIQHAGSGTLAINASTLDDQRGTIVGNGSVDIHAGVVNHDAASTFGQNITLQAASLSNQAGHLNSGAAMNVSVLGQLDNRTGDISGNGALSVYAGAVDNSRGAMTSAQSLSVGSAGALNNSDGIITAAHAVNVNGQAVDNTRGTLQAGDGALTLGAASVDNTDGLLSAGTDLQVSTTGDLHNNSVIYAGRDQTLAVGGTLNNSGSVAARHDLTVNAGSVLSGASALLGAGIQADGSLAQSGQLTVNAAGALQATGRNVAAGNAFLSGASVDLHGGQTGAANIALTATNGNVNTAQAHIGTPGTLSVTATAGTLDNRNGDLSANQLALNVAGLNNDHGSIVQSGAGDTSIAMGGTLDNTAGRIAVNSANLSLNAGTLINIDGTLEHAGSGTLAINAGNLSDQRGQITSNHALNITAGTMDHRDAVSVAQQITIASTSLDNRHGQIAQLGNGNASVSASGLLDNSAGDIASNGALQVSGGTVNNSGGHIAAAGSTGVHAQVALNNTSGFIGAGTQLNVTGGDVNNAGGNLQALGGNATLNVADLSNAAGSIYAAGNLVTNAANVNNSGNMYAAGTQSLSASGALINSALIAAHGDTAIHAASVNSSNTSLLAGGVNLDGSMAQSGNLTVSATAGLTALGQTLAPDSVTLSGASVDVSGAQIGSAALGLSATGGNLVTSDAQIATAGSLNLNASGTLVNQRGTLSAGALSAHVGGLDNTQGLIVQTGTGDVDLTMGGTLNNAAGRIAVNSANLTLGAGNLVNTDGRIEHAGSGTLAINAGSISDVRGQITGNGSLHITAGNIDHRDASTIAQNITISAASLDNRQGEITQLGTSNTTISTTGLLDNRAGVIASNGGTTVNTGSLNNQGGVLQAAGTAALSVGATGTLDNSNAGLIAGGGNTTLAANTILNQLGTVTAGGALNAAASQGIQNAKGVLLANAGVTLTAGSLDNSAGQLASVNGSINATTTGATVNDSGLIQAAGSIVLGNGGLSNKQAAGNTAAGSIVATNVTIDTHGQSLDNGTGTIAAAQLLDVRSGALNNDAGLLQGGSGVSINTSGAALSNANSAAHAAVAGGIVSGGAAALNVGAWNNAAGFFGASGAVTGTTGQITNTLGGQIVGETSVDLTIAGLNNQGGQIQTLGDLALRAGAGTIVNRQSLIRSGATLTLNAGTIDNRDTGGVNQGLEAKDVVLTASNLNNTAGAVRADNNASFTGNGSLDNTQGLISAGNTLSVNDASRTLSLNNTGGTFIAGQNASIRAGSFGGEGRTLSLGNLTLDLGGSLLLGGAGQISANGDTTLILGGDLTNIGQVHTGGTLTITAQNINNTASGDISGYATRLNAAGSLTNRGVIDGVYTQLNAGAIYNIGSGKIYGDHLSIGAGSLTNDVEGGVAATIAARGRLDIGAQSISNSEHALILSGGDMAIGGALDANGFATGRAATVTNSSATIEALGDLSLNTSQLNNLNAHFSTQMGAPVSSGTFVEFEGKGTGIRYAEGTPGVYTYNEESLHLHTPENNYEEWNRYDITRTTSQTEVVSSDPGRIVSGGALSINADSILNRDSHILAGGTLSIAAGVLNNESTMGQRVTSDQGSVTANWRIHHKGADESGHSTTPYAPPDQIQTISLGAARLESGASGVANGGNVPGALAGNNVNGSASAAGAAGAVAKQAAIIKVGASVGAVDNASGQGAAGAQGTDGINSSDRTGGAGQHGQLGGASGAQAAANGGAGGPGAVAALALQQADNGVNNQHAGNAAGAAVPQGTNHGGIISAVIRAVAGSQASTAPGSVATDNAGIAVNTASNGGAAAGKAQGAGVPAVAAVGRIAQVALTNPSGGAQIVRTTSPTTRVPDASLFTINRASTASYLIETDPRFANYRNWLGSDYMLGQLQLDPNVTQKRLGDGYYEQTLIREQVAQLTGRRFLGDYTSDDTEYRALMDAGVAYAKTWNLRPGVALSDAQMAVLSSDIVWLVEKEITLKDGSVQKALVPQVYVRLRDGDIDGSGALLSGKDVNLQVTGDLVNSGSIAGRDVVRLTADSVQNLGGRIHGDAVSVAAKTDLNNIGGTISANSLLVATAGRDINIETTTRSATSAVGGNTFSRTTTDRVAGLYVTGEGAGGTLLATAGRDIKLTAGQISNAAKDGNTVLDAGRNIELGTVQNAAANNLKWDAKNSRKDSATTEVGSQIVAAGNIALKAGTDINLRAAQVQAGGALSAQAGNNINVVAGVATATLDEAHEHKEKGFLKSKTTTSRDTIASTSVVGSNLTGGTVAMVSGKDINVQGSTVLGEGAVNLAASNNLTIAAVADSHQETHSVAVKKSGLTGGFSAGVISVGVGKSSSAGQSSVDQVGQVGAIVGSTEGNARLQAGEKLSVVASDIGAGKDLTLIGKNVELTAAQETSVEKSAQQSKSSGFAVGITVDPFAAFNNAKQESEKGNRTTSTVGKTLKRDEAIGKGLLAASTAVVVQAGSRSSEATQDHATSGARVSTLKAGGDLTILATGGSIASEGANMSAEGNAMLMAKDNINLGVAHNTEGQAQDSKAKGASFDNRGPLMVGAFNQKGNGKGNTDSITGTTLSVGGAATLATTTGDITITGSNVVANGDTAISAARNLTIESGQNTLANDNHSNNKAIGEVVISDTERFAGYNRIKHNDTSAQQTQVESNVGSLNGNVTLTAGEKYTQVASNVLADKDVSITAKTIDVTTAANTRSSAQDNSDLKVGAFARISSPFIDLANTVESAKESDGRLQKMQGMAAGVQAYQAVQAVKSGSLIKGEVGVGFASASSKDKSSGSEAIGSTIKGGGNVSLTSTEGGITATGANIGAGKTLALDSAKDIVLQASQSTATSDGSNKSSGVEVGVGYSVGAQTGVYAYAAANVGKGDYKNTATINNNTHLSGDSVDLVSKGDTTLKGAAVKANTISADIGGKLAIESLQDTTTQHNQQSNAGVRVQVSFGTAWEVSGNASHSQANGSSSAVAEQSGLFAGDGGYHVKADTVALKGGAIASTSAANSELTTKAITFENLQNKTEFKAMSGSVSGSTEVARDVAAGSDGKPATKQADVDQSKGLVSTGAKKGTAAPGVPMFSKESESATTYATLTDGKLNIGGQAMDSAASLGAHTDASTANKTIAPLKDLKAVVAEQKALAAATGTIVATVGPMLANYVGDIGKEKQDAAARDASRYTLLAETAATKGDTEAASAYTALAAEAQTTANNWGDNGVYRVGLHAAAQGLLGGLVGGSAGAGAASSGVVAGNLGQQLGEAMGEAEAKKLGLTGDDAKRLVKTYQETGATIAGALGGAIAGGQDAGAALVGAAQGGSTARNIELYNRQLHPTEIDFLHDKGRIARYISFMAGKGMTLTEAQASTALDRFGAAMVDEHWAALNGRDGNTEQFIKGEAAKTKLSYTDNSGTSHAGFGATLAEYKNETINLKSLMDGYQADPNVGKFLTNNQHKVDPAVWNRQFAAGQAKGYAAASNDSNIISDIGTILSGFAPSNLAKIFTSDEVGPIDSERMKFYYQTLLKIQGRPGEAGYVYEYDWATTQRLAIVGMPLAEVGGTLVSKALQAGKAAVVAGRAGAAAADGAIVPAKTVPSVTQPNGPQTLVLGKDGVYVPAEATPTGNVGAQGTTLPALADVPATQTAVQATNKAEQAVAQDAKAAKGGDNPLAVCTDGSCFVAGTLVQTATGLQAIETFRGGELVLSRHEETGEIGYRPVVATKQTHDQELYEVVVRNAQGATEILHTTAEHPFWVAGKGWLKASLLEGGHELVSRDDDAALSVVGQRALGESATVYNIQVHEHSTYHVGTLGVWVHNADCCDLVAKAAATETSRGVISKTKLTASQIELDVKTVRQKEILDDIVKNKDLGGTKTEELVNSVITDSQGGKVLDGGKYGSNNGYDHVAVWTDADGNVNLTMTIDSKQLGAKGIILDPKAAGGVMQMSDRWDAAVLAKLEDSPAKDAVLAAIENGTLVKGVAYVDKATGKLYLSRIDPKVVSPVTPVTPVTPVVPKPPAKK